MPATGPPAGIVGKEPRRASLLLQCSRSLSPRTTARSSRAPATRLVGATAQCRLTEHACSHRPWPRPSIVKLWNTIGECKLTLDDGHADWVSAVRFSPSPENPIFVSASWDKTVKVWSLTNFKLRADLVGHTGYISAVTVSPDGSLCASGGKDGIAMLWDLNEGKRLYSLEAGTISAWRRRRVGGRRRPCSTSSPPLCSPLAVLLPQPLLALRRDVQEHHHLGPR